MPTRDYDPINDIIEAIHKTSVSTWPTIKATADTNGSVYISCGNPDSCIATTPIKIVVDGSLPIVEEKPVDPFAIRSVLSNRRKNAFTVVWEDGTTTVVHCQEGDEWDDEKALAMCFTKKALGNKGNFNDKFNDALDNKMKIIPAEPAPKKECDCDGACTECKCEKPTNAFGLNKQTAAELGKAANKADVALKDMINALTGDVASKINKVEKTKEYKIYICSALTGEKKRHLATRYSVQEVRDFVKEYSKEASYGWYFRTWNTTGGMYIDYGSYTNYLLVEGMDNSEYVKK